nr:putative reverse transcriptase domain-containing protein [Tanacetum cinerariifolium]
MIPKTWIRRIGVSWGRDHAQIRRIFFDGYGVLVIRTKSKTYDCDEEQENAFQTLKDKLCNAPIMALPDGPEDFMVYCDASGLRLGCALMQRAQKEACDESVGLQKGADKMYYNLRDRYWWSGMNKDIAVYVSRREDYNMDRLARLYLNKIVVRQGLPISIISDHDSRFTSRLCQSMQEVLGTHLDMSTAYHPQTDCQTKRKIQTLEDMLRACVQDFEGKIGEVQLIGHELVQETTEKISQINDRLKTARDRHKSYADKRRKPLEFSVGDYVLLKVSPWKGVVRFGKKGKLAPRFIETFEIVEKVGLVAYRLRLPEELNGVHDTFHVSNLKKCLADPTLQVSLDEIQVDAKFNFVEEPVEILEKEIKKLKQSRIAIIKVWWNLKCGPEFMREREDHMRLKYPHMFSSVSG